MVKKIIKIEDLVGEVYETVERLVKAGSGAWDDFFPTNETISPMRINNNVISGQMNMFEHDDCLNVFILCPGFKKENINIVVEDDLLKIKGEEEYLGKVDGITNSRLEFSVVNFERKINLKGLYDSSKISVVLENGILKLEIPKKKSKKNSIEIKIK